MNNGYEPGHKENPIFVDTGNDATYSGYETNDHRRRRSVFTDIREEDDRDKNVGQNDSENNSEVRNIDHMNKLNHVHLEMEPQISRISCGQQKLIEP